MKKRGLNTYGKICLFLVFALLIIVNIQFSSAFTMQEKEALLKEKCGDKLKIIWDTKTGNPADISGYTSCDILGLNGTINITTENIQEFVEKVFFELKQYYQDLNESNLMIEPIREFNNGNGKFEYSIHYNQYYNNIKLENSGLGYNILSNGEMLYMGSSYKSNINLDTNPKISVDDAIKIAKIYVNFNDGLINTKTNIRKSIITNITILPIEKNDSYNYKLSWKIRLYTIKPLMDETLYIDAINGDILDQKGNLVSAYNCKKYGTCNNDNTYFKFESLFVLSIVLVIIFIFLFLFFKKIRNKS